MAKRAAKVWAFPLILVVVWGSPILTRGAFAQNVARVGYVDLQRVLIRSAAGVAARDQLQKDMAAMQKDLNSKVGELEKLREEFDKKGALLSAAARKEKQETLERKLRDLQRLKDDSERELAKKEQELRNKFLADIVGVVERIGKQRGFLMIVEKREGGVIYGTPDADLTDEIIKAFDQEAGKGKK